MVIQNNFLDEEFRKPIDCSQLSYNNKSQESCHVNMAIDLVPPQGPQYVLNEEPVLNPLSPPHVDNVIIINIQLPYDPN